MNFAEAFNAAKGGSKIVRAGWNEKEQWVAYVDAYTLADVLPDGNQVPTQYRLERNRMEKLLPQGDVKVGGYFVIWTSKGVWQPGWTPSQGDLNADDWATRA